MDLEAIKLIHTRTSGLCGRTKHHKKKVERYERVKIDD
jgi:hypothetical protein